MKLVFILLMLLLLVGCNEKVIKMKSAYDIQCEGLDRSSVKNPVITIGENIVIRYEKPYVELNKCNKFKSYIF